MSAKRLVLGAVLALGSLGLGALGLTRWAAERAVRGPERVAPSAAPAAERGLAELDAALARALAHTTLESEATALREDADGEWTVHTQVRRLPMGQVASEVAEALAVQLRASGGEAGLAPEVYVTSEDALSASLRVYLGKRPTHVISLRPSLGAPARSERRPEIALVVTNLGALGPSAGALLASTVPFTVVVTPYSPFALRHSWDATRSDVELVVTMGPEDARGPAAARLLDAVYHPTAVSPSAALPELPLSALYDRGLYLFDVEGVLSPSQQRAARGAGVFVLRPDVVLGEQLADDALRIAHLAAERGQLVVSVDSTSPAAAQVIAWLSASERSVRPVYLGELVPPLSAGVSPPGPATLAPATPAPARLAPEARTGG